MTDQNTFTVDLRRSPTANGGREWYFVLGSTPIYPNEHRVGVFTDANVTAEEAFKRVLRAWGVDRAT